VKSAGVFIAAALLVVACGSGSASITPTKPPSALVVFTTWVADAKVTNGPEPGYKPAFAGLTGHDIQSASPIIDSTGTVWFVNLSFTQRGANLFAKLTRDNVGACPGDPNTSLTANCAGRHLTIWLDLTQADIDNWDDPTYVTKVSQLYDLPCLLRPLPTTVCPKFLSDPITLQEINGGSAVIGCACTQQGARELAGAINSETH
jgi:preprotein translocase subunit SecD